MKSRIKLTTQISTAAIALVLTSSSASANWFSDKFSPKEPESTQGKVIDKTKPAKKATSQPRQIKKNDVLLVNSLNGIAILGKPNQIKPEGFSFNLNGIKHMDKSVVLPDNVKKLMQSYIGKPLTMNGLNDMVQAMMKAYTDEKIQISTVIVPEQTISNGGLQLLIVTGRLGNVKVTNNKYFDKNIYMKEFTTRKDEIIKSDKILEDLRWMNRNMFRRVDVIYTPGTGYGRTDVELRATEAKPQSFYAGVNNTGSKLLGKQRYFIGGQFGGLFNKDHQFSFQYTTNNKKGTSLKAISGEYRIPLKDRQEVRFNAAYSTYSAPVNNLTAKGKSSSLGADYYRALPRVANFGSDLHLGVKQKRSDNFSLLSGFSGAVSGKKYNYSELTVGWQGEQQKMGSRTLASADVVYDTGKGTDYLNNASINVGFTALRANVKHVNDFKNDTRLTIGSRLQWASKSSIPSAEEFYLGGQNSVRGFASNVSRDPDGIVINATYRGSNLLKNNKKLIGHQIRPYAFIDSGYGHVKEPTVNEKKSKKITGAGIGFNYKYGRNVDLDVAYGVPLSDKDIPESQRDKRVIHGSLVVRY